MDASWPAAGASDTFGKLGVCTGNAALTGFDQLGRLDPTQPLVACQRSNIVPSRASCLIRLEGFA